MCQRVLSFGSHGLIVGARDLLSYFIIIIFSVKAAILTTVKVKRTVCVQYSVIK